ncbi:OB-fold domain-containing protein [uncultured Marivita sp.]|uniref:Zn-ribbon domain-containing OB-fold protein n=1 Tax=uncultured Marivita sp. TaxID=888080 RepID=UPI0026200493|nr:OB-fold domain-containing protein [uncultured Marivita sp.]
MTDDPTQAPAGDAVNDAVLPMDDLAPDPEGDFVVRDGAVMLRGARSASSGVEAFPARPICPETGAYDMEPALFGPEAVLYSFSTIHVSATRPTPYTLGYVDFPSGLRAFAHVRAPADALACDLPVVLRAEGSEWWVEPA